jgi:hypothetical protein
MAAKKCLPSLDTLNTLFVLDAEQGVLRRRVTRAPNAKVGDIVGTIDGKGYLHVVISGRFYRVHRIIYYMYYGGDPSSHLDHINCDRRDNRPENLRPATDQQNAGNTRLPSHNTSGYKGVYRHSRGRKWCAQIKRAGVTTYLGWFDTAREAAEAYKKAAKEHFGEYARSHDE